MDIKEIKARRNDLNTQIFELIKKFEEDTKVVVDSLEINRCRMATMLGGQYILAGVYSEVHVP